MARGSQSLETAYRHAVITYGAMAASTVLYVVAVAVVSIAEAPFEGFAGQMPGLRIALWTAATFEAGLIGIVRRALLGSARTGDEDSQARRIRPAIRGPVELHAVDAGFRPAEQLFPKRT